MTSRNHQFILTGLIVLAFMTVLHMSRLDYIPDLSISINGPGNTTSYRPPAPASIEITSNRNHHTIVVFNPAYWVPMKLFNEVLSNQCAYNNCILSRNRSSLRDQSAIMYILTQAPGLPVFPPLSPSDRRPDQVWIYIWAEAPSYRAWNGRVKNIYWRSAVNWTMTYTLDADVSMPYGRLIKRTPPVRNYSAIFRGKNKMAAWAVGHCQTVGKRERYVQELRSHGISVDIFGKCTGNMIKRGDLRDMINKTYMFYLAFENTFCKDYVTEKFFAYFQLDVILVVRGAANYSNMLPNNSYINTADFRSAKDLAKYLRIVASDEKRYTDYLRNKDHFESYHVGTGVRNASFCNMCEKLNNLDRNRRTYTDFVQNIFNGTCTTPNDISSITSKLSVFNRLNAG